MRLLYLFTCINTDSGAAITPFGSRANPEFRLAVEVFFFFLNHYILPFLSLHLSAPPPPPRIRFRPRAKVDVDRYRALLYAVQDRYISYAYCAITLL